MYKFIIRNKKRRKTGLIFNKIFIPHRACLNFLIINVTYNVRVFLILLNPETEKRNLFTLPGNFQPFTGLCKEIGGRMIYIKNLKVFNCNVNESFHWSKLPKLKEKMSEDKFVFNSYADLRYANLRYADLSYADLRFADLCYADLRFADLRFANLRYANLRYADLRYADLRYANLRFADLRYANLCSAKLKPIDNKEVIIKDFMSVCGLGSENRQTMIFDTNIGIVLQCGCFYGTEEAFKKQVKETHNGNNYEKEYLEMLKLAKIRFSR